MSRHRNMVLAGTPSSPSAPMRARATALKIEEDAAGEKPIAFLPLVAVISMVWLAGTFAASLVQPL